MRFHVCGQKFRFFDDPKGDFNPGFPWGRDQKRAPGKKRRLRDIREPASGGHSVSAVTARAFGGGVRVCMGLFFFFFGGGGLKGKPT